MSAKWNGGWALQFDIIAFRISGDNFCSWLRARKWLIDLGGDLTRVHKGRRCFWPHGWIHLIGFQVGAGIYVDLGATVSDTAMLEGHEK